MENTSAYSFLKRATVFLVISMSCSQCLGLQTQDRFSFFQLSGNRTQQWRNLDDVKEMKMSVSTVLAGVCCFISATISSAGGIGGGGLYIPILTIVAGLELKSATGFSAFMVTGGSIANVIYNLVISSPRFGNKAVIDYDIALLSEPCMLLGVSIGVVCNLVFPEWLVTILFAVFLAWSTSKTCRNGFLHWKRETDRVNRCNIVEKLEDVVGEDERLNAGVKSIKQPLLMNVQVDNSVWFPWKKLGVLVLIWFCFFALYVVRGNKYGEV